jgi:hypothetical protein
MLDGCGACELLVMARPARIPTVMTTSRIAASANLMESGTSHGDLFFSKSAVLTMTLVAKP